MTNTRELGQSQSTADYSQSALRLRAAYRKLCGLPEEFTSIEMEGDKCRVYIGKMLFWAANHPIPQRFDADLKPSNPENKQCLVPDTIVGYIGQHLKEIRAALPDHGDWRSLSSDEYPEWWTIARQAFLLEAARYQLKCGADIVFGYSAVKPLYREVNGRTKGDKI